MAKNERIEKIVNKHLKKLDHLTAFIDKNGNSFRRCQFENCMNLFPIKNKKDKRIHCITHWIKTKVK